MRFLGLSSKKVMENIKVRLPISTVSGLEDHTTWGQSSHTSLVIHLQTEHSNVFATVHFKINEGLLSIAHLLHVSPCGGRGLFVHKL